MVAPLLGVDATLGALLDCICERLADSGAPVCVCATTVGTPAVLCNCDCPDGDGAGELWANLTRLYRADRNSGLDAAPTRPCAPTSYYAQLRVTLVRCFPSIDERGELPSAEDRAAAAATLHADAAEVATAVACCALADQAYLENVAVDLDPQGGCSILTANIRVAVSVRRPDNLRE